MFKLKSAIGRLLLIPVLLLACGQARAVNPTYEYHADARMRQVSGELVDHAYGYAYVVTDKKGHGVIRVMFSNGSPLHGARFNAHLSFVDADGVVIREEHFDRHIEAADAGGAQERSVSKLVKLADFASVQVDFFVSDIPGSADAGDYVTAAYSGN